MTRKKPDALSREECIRRMHEGRRKSDLYSSPMRDRAFAKEAGRKGGLACHQKHPEHLPSMAQEAGRLGGKTKRRKHRKMLMGWGMPLEK